MFRDQRVILERLYDGVSTAVDSDVRSLTSKEQSNLRKYFKKSINVSGYDRIVLFLRFKKLTRQVDFLQTIPNLVFLEHDAYQNYIKCKYQNQYSKMYHRIPWARIISSGAAVARKLRDEGLDAVFVSKGFDQQLLRNLNKVRDIELGFLGSIKSMAYSQRRTFLEDLSQEENLLVTRTESGENYLQTLNRIRFFVSADVGMGEYMIKNFEAMACGCVLFAYSQGEEENKALGFQDMNNVVLYHSIGELRAKLALLRNDEALASEISQQGQELAESRYSFQRVGELVAEALYPPLRTPKKPTALQVLRNKIGF